MTKQCNTLVFCIFLTACGGSGGDSGSAGATPAAATSVSTTTTTVAAEAETFADLSVPEQFDWQTQGNVALDWQLVSNISLNNGEPLPLSGHYIIRVYPLDDNAIKQSDPLYTGMTNRYGELTGHIPLSRQASGVMVEVQIDEQACQIVLSPEEIATMEDIECEVLADSDL